MGGSSSESTTQGKETQLSKEQAKIVVQRQEDYENYYKKYLISGVQDNSNGVAVKANMAQQTAGINQNYRNAKQTFAQNIAQRGLGGTGVEVQGLSSLSNARSQNLANAYYSAQQQAENNRLNYLQLALQMSPSTTTAAPTLSYGKSESKSIQIGG